MANKETPKKVLIIRFSSMGDIVLTTPVIRALKTQMKAEIHYFTKAHFAELLSQNPYIDRLILLKDNLFSHLRKLQTEGYDYIIDLHHNLRTFFVKMALWRTKAYSFPKLNLEKELLIHFRWNRLPRRHVVERYMDTVKPLGVGLDKGGLDFFISQKDEEKAYQALPSHFSQNYIAYVIGAKWATKKLPLPQMIRLCRYINRPMVLLGGKAEAADADAVQRSVSIRVVNLCGVLSIAQSAAIIKGATHVFAHDTGLMHIAAALGKHVYAIFGSTIPEFGVVPYRTPHTILENKTLSCRPCTKYGKTHCPKGHFACMRHLKFEFKLP